MLWRLIAIIGEDLNFILRSLAQIDGYVALVVNE